MKTLTLFVVVLSLSLVGVGCEPTFFTKNIGDGVTQVAPTMTLLLSASQSATGDAITFSVIDGDGKDITNESVVFPEDGVDGWIQGNTFYPQKGGDIRLIAVHGNRRSREVVLKNEASKWLSIEGPRIVNVGQDLQLTVFQRSGGFPEDKSGVVEYTLLDHQNKPVANNENDFASLSMSGVLHGKANGFVTVRMRRVTLGLETRQTVRIGNPTVENLIVPRPYYLGMPGQEFYPSIGLKCNGHIRFGEGLLASSEMVTSNAIVAEVIANKMVRLVNPGQTMLHITMGGKSADVPVLTFGQYDSTTPQTGYKIFKVSGRHLIVVDRMLLKHRINLGEEYQWYLIDAQGNYTGNLSFERRGNILVGILPHTVFSGHTVRMGFYSVAKNDQGYEEYTPDGSAGDITFYGTDSQPNHNGLGRDLVFTLP